MPFFANYRLAPEEVERALNRPLSGGPSGGEHAVLAALNRDRLGDVRRLLERDGSLGPDFRELLEERLRMAQLRQGDVKSWSVVLPVAILDEYRKLARRANVGISDILREAIQRDFRARREALDTVAALKESVLDYHRAANQVLDQARAVVERLGPIQDLANRMTRLEKMLGGGSSA